ncbi:hypothetical protein KA529_04170, partial [Candidatus Saccharibacteria bacterium]|nr:hypothetical protein [Candidatus Saccharibacteria bacterium]
SELELSENGKIVLLIGIVLIVGGIVAASWVLLTQDDKLAALIGVFAAASGVIALVLASNKQIVIRKNSDSTVRQTRLISKQVKQRSFDARQASMVELEVQQRTETDGKGKKDKSIDSVIRLILLNDDKVELDRSSFNGGSKGSQLNGVELASFSPMKSEAQAIADFLDIPLQINDLSTLAGAVDTFKGLKDEYINKEKTEIEEIPVAPKTQTAAEAFAAEQVAARIASNASSASAPVVWPSVISPAEPPAVAPMQAQAAPHPATALPQVDGQIAVDSNLIIQPDQINLQPKQPVQSFPLVQQAPADQAAQQQIVNPARPVQQAPQPAAPPAQIHTAVQPVATIQSQQNAPAPVVAQTAPAEPASPPPQQVSPPNTVFYPAQPQAPAVTPNTERN